MAVYRRPVGGGLNASNEKNETQQAATANKNKVLDAVYLDQLRQLINGGGQPQGGGGMGGMSFGGGGGGHRGGGGFDPFAEQRRHEAELNRQKMILIDQLNKAKSAAMPAIQQYGRQYQADINNVFGQNRKLNSGYQHQLQQLAAQMNNGVNSQARGLSRDLQGQGANGPEMQAMMAAARQSQQGNNFLQQNASGYQTRLAQMMAAAQADSRSMGAAINASSKGQLQNSYANLLAQIGMIGLQ